MAYFSLVSFVDPNGKIGNVEIESPHPLASRQDVWKVRRVISAESPERVVIINWLPLADDLFDGLATALPGPT